MENCKIQEVHYSKNTPPLLANFECSLPSKTENLNIHFFEQPKTSKKLVAVSSDKCVYTSHIQNDSENLCRTLIAIRRKNKVFLHEVKPVLLAVAKKLGDNKENTETDLKQDSIQNLNKQFGSKKTKRLAEQRERMKVKIDVVGKYLNETVSEINETLNANELENVKQLTITPTYEPIINRNATSINEVYRLNDYLTSEEMNELAQEAKNILKGTFKDINCQCLYIKEEIAKIQSESCSYPEKEKIKRISILLYAEYIFRYLKSKLNEFNKKSFLLYSEALTRKILDLFSVKSAKLRLRPYSMRYKCLCYMLVLFLMVSERYLIDLEDIASKLNVSINVLKQLAKVVGAKPSSSSPKLYEVRLPLPELKLSKPKVGGKK